jgi:hypothetical protein
MADQPPPLIPVEVMSPGAGLGQQPGAPPGPKPFTPIHPVAAAVLLVVDNLWNFADWAVLTWVVTIPLGFLSVFLPTLVLQRVSRRDPWSRALGKALLLGVVAAVPTSITGTPLGMALLAWAGVEKLRR